MLTLRIFISSPGDVLEERRLARAVIERVEHAFQGGVRLVPVVWEDAPLRATSSFQEGIDEQLPLTSIDLVVFILWSRLGTPLGARYRDGQRELTGTEWEFEQARASFQKRGSPDLLVYRRTADPHLPSPQREPAAFAEATAQFQAVVRFFERWFSDQGAGRMARLPYGTPQGFEERFEKNLTLWVAQRLGSHADERATWKGSPFRGLLAFEPQHAPVFFGRARATHEALAALQIQAAAGTAFLLLLGASGAGKSSLARAGLLPRLRRPRDILPELAEGFVVHAVMKPSNGTSPFEGLVAALADPMALGSDAGGAEASQARALAFRESPSAVVAYVRERLGERARTEQQRERLAEAPAVRLLLFVDQLEELFALEGVTGADRRAFGRILEALATSGMACVLATLRNDFYARLAELPEVLELRGEAGSVELLAPNSAEVADMVRGPATVARLVYERHPQDGRGLDEELIDEANRHPGILPLIQLTLDALYHARDGARLTWTAYEALGGLTGALRAVAEKALAGLDPQAQAALPLLVRSLAEVQEGEEGAVTRRRPRLAALRQDPAVGRLVDALLEARLLEADKDLAGEPIVGAAHEVVLTAWDRVASLVKEAREILQIRARVRSAAEYWVAGGRDESALLPEGLPLRDGERLLATRLLDLEERSRELIESSLAAARERAAAERERGARLFAAARTRRNRRRAVLVALPVLAAIVWFVAQRLDAAALQRRVDTARALLVSGELAGAADALGAARAKDADHADVRLLESELRTAQGAHEHAQKVAEAWATAGAARERAAEAERAILGLREKISQLEAEVQQEEATAFRAYAPPERRAAFHAKQQHITRLRLDLDRLVGEAHEAIEAGARAEGLIGGTSQMTLLARAEHFMARWREAVAAGDELRAARAREQVEAVSSQYRGELEGQGKLEIEVEPREAEVFLFRYLPYEAVRTDRQVIPRLVPVPSSGVECRAQDEAWLGFRPGDPCLVVTAVLPQTVAVDQLRPGDLVTAVNGGPCGEGLFVSATLADGPAEGARVLDRIVSVDGRAVEVESDWTQALASRTSEEGEIEVVLERGRQRVRRSVPRGVPMDRTLGVASVVEGPALLASVRAPAGGLWLACLRDGRALPLDVPAGAVSGVVAERTASPLLFAPGANAWPMGAGARPVDPGSYLVVARAPGHELQRFPVLVPRGGTTKARLRLHPLGTTPPDFVYVPAGAFEVGGDEGAHAPLPPTSIDMVGTPALRDGFFIGRREVTVGEWYRFLNDDVTRAVIADAVQVRYVPRDSSNPGGYVDPDAQGRYAPHADERLSITGVTWSDITDDTGFLAWRNRQPDAARWRFSLPTDVEWERAARGADHRTHPWGDVFDYSLAASKHARPFPADALPPGSLVAGESPFGVLDLAGGRWEWTASTFSVEGGTYSLRGACWDDTLPTYFRISSRLERKPGHVSPFFGFRLVARPR